MWQCVYNPNTWDESSQILEGCGLASLAETAISRLSERPWKSNRGRCVMFTLSSLCICMGEGTYTPHTQIHRGSRVLTVTYSAQYVILMVADNVALDFYIIFSCDFRRYYLPNERACDAACHAPPASRCRDSIQGYLDVVSSMCCRLHVEND